MDLTLYLCGRLSCGAGRGHSRWGVPGDPHRTGSWGNCQLPLLSLNYIPALQQSLLVWLLSALVVVASWCGKDGEEGEGIVRDFSLCSQASGQGNLLCALTYDTSQVWHVVHMYLLNLEHSHNFTLLRRAC